jgi:hypothetical protein
MTFSDQKGTLVNDDADADPKAAAPDIDSDRLALLGSLFTVTRANLCMISKSRTSYQTGSGMQRCWQTETR